jgi:hypothetical protein
MKTNNHYLIQKVVIYFCEKLVKLNLLFTVGHKQTQYQWQIRIPNCSYIMFLLCRTGCV